MRHLPALAVEGGALLFKTSTLEKGQEEQARITARGIVRALDLMQVRAAGIAPQDLAAGVDFLRELDRSQAMTWLSLNLVDSRTGTPVFSPHLIISLGGLRIGLLGLTDDHARVKAPYQVLSWEKTLSQGLDTIAPQVDMVILLSSYPEPVNTRIAGSLPAIHLVVQAGHRGSNRNPWLVNRTLFCQTGPQGKYQGVLHIDWNDGRTWGSGPKEKLDRLRNQLDRVNWQMHRMEKRLPEEQLRREVRYNRLQQQKEELERTLQELNQQKKTEQKVCTYRNRFIALKTSLPEDPAVQEIVDEIRISVNRLNKKMLSRIRSNGENRLQQLAGWRRCGECHPKQTAFWQETDHAAAWQTLEEEDQQFNRQCVGCHVTLPRHEAEATGRSDLVAALSESLKAVGCESCHGPGKAHASNPEVVHLMAISSSTCLHCHTGEHDDNFRFEEKLDKIRCPASPAGTANSNRRS